jgi:hypothetical protein
VITSWRKIHVAALLFNELAIAKTYYTVHTSATCSYPVGLNKNLKSSNKNSKAFIAFYSPSQAVVKCTSCSGQITVAVEFQ